MPDTADVVVIGGGAAGCAVAYYLARAGVKATVIERHGVGSQASGFSAGGLNPLEGAGIPGPLAPLAEESFKMHAELRDRLADESGVEFAPHMIAVVGVAFDEADYAGMQETLDIFQGAGGFAAHWLDAYRVRELEPRIAEDALGGLYAYGNAALNSLQFTVAMSKAAEKLGAQFRTGEVVGLKTSGSRVTGLTLADGEVACDAVVVATGPWVADCEKWLGVPIPVKPLKGEIVRTELAGSPLTHDYSWGGVNLFHRRDGLVWVGATEEDRGFDDEPSESGRRYLMERATRLMPAMAEAKVVKHTACLRPVTADWLPIIGAAPGWDNAYLATGAGKKGILIAPGIGKAVADLVTNGATSLPVGDFGLRRFG